MKSSILIAVLTSFCTFVFAQKPEAKTRAEDSTEPAFAVPMTNTWLNRFEKRQNKMIKIIGLSQLQKRSLDTLNDHYVTQRAILQDDKSINLHTRNAKTQLLRREREAKFKSFLTPEQIIKWNDLRKGQRKKTFRKK